MKQNTDRSNGNATPLVWISLFEGDLLARIPDWTNFSKRSSKIEGLTMQACAGGWRIPFCTKNINLLQQHFGEILLFDFDWRKVPYHQSDNEFTIPPNEAASQNKK